MESKIPLIKLFLLLGILILLSSKKIKVGYVLLIATILTEILFPIPLKIFILKVLESSFDFRTIKIIILVFSIIVLSNLMEKRNLLHSMVMYLEKLKLPKKILFILLPAFIGLLPMPGGALFSAPMVDEAVKKENFTAEEKTFINYWFRHIWEYFLPLYPGVILVSGLYGVSFINFLKFHGIFTILMIIIGWFMIFRGKKFSSNISKDKDLKKSFYGLIYSIFPVILIFLFVFVWNIETYIGVILSILFSFLLYKCKFSEIVSFIKSSLRFDMLIMILGIFYFKKALEITGAINLLPSLFPETNNIAVILILTFLPLISGLLTGITIAYVGISFPILSSYFIINGHVNMCLETLAYISGFIGVLLSPVHLCLLLTNEYFKSNLMKVYKLLIPCGTILFITLIIYYFLLKFFLVH